MNIERRKFTRYQVPSDAIFLYSNHAPIHGWVKDISYGGMAFEYTPVNGCEIKEEITLILMADKFPLYLSDIPCTVIHDEKSSIIDEAFKGTETRRCGVQYKELSEEIQEQLKALLTSELMIPGM